MISTPSLDLYTNACNDAASVVISAYSTSFGAAVRLLGSRHRQHVRNVYALVRIADELVDGVATEAGINETGQLHELDELESRTYEAITLGYSSDAIVHAFAVTARSCGIEKEIITPFFQSMRTDISSESLDFNNDTKVRSFTTEEHSEYVYGSAEVIGLMCLRIFMRDSKVSEDERTQLENSAKQLGAAFQNINFLRDLKDDSKRLGRDYLGAEKQLTDAQRLAWIEEINMQIVTAETALPILPKDARRAVRCALEFFKALTHRLEKTSASQLYERRIRVPNPIKFALVAKASAQTILERA
ncbi:MAG TPA: squalene/phytoene synthase family protein [Microbacteriaceae bacterium]|nr:squalene/phytoene synthase family protein [Microbacteriaceae bacterium]